MSRMPSVLAQWVPLAVLAGAVAALVYLTAQQVWRQQANDPQVQLAEDAAARLAAGAAPAAVVLPEPVDIGRSLAPFVTVFDASGRVLATSGRLHAADPVPPAGVLARARRTGGNGVTWQPEPGVRIATIEVAVHGSDGTVVLAGRSLREVERRVSRFGTIVALGLLATLVALLVAVSACNVWLGAQPRVAASSHF
jgi:hypothetical protein